MRAAGSTLTLGELVATAGADGAKPNDPITVTTASDEFQIESAHMDATGIHLELVGDRGDSRDVLRSVLDELEKRARTVGRKGQPAAWVRDFLLDMGEEYGP